MVNKTGKTEAKRPSKGQRKYIQRLKQAARKEAGTNRPHSGTAQPVRVHKKQDDS
jgi:hypothetical protein